MTWSFGDSFDLYAAVGDMFNGYWDSGLGMTGLVAGRFSNSRGIQLNNNPGATKSSGANDPVHHFTVAFQQNAGISGSTLCSFIELLDGTTAQCTIVFRSDGAILLTSGGPTGTILATYTGAFPVASTWYAFEFEVVINNTTGSFAVRKNGNTVNDFTATGLNTRPTSTNNYANKLQIGQQSGGTHYWDDFFWQSGAAAGTWLGDIRCFTRMPASDAAVQFSQAPSPVNQGIYPAPTNANFVNTATYLPFIANFSGALGSAGLNFQNPTTVNVKMSLFDANGAGGGPGAVLASTNVLVNAASAGLNYLTFPSPYTVTRGTPYYLGFVCDRGSIPMMTGATSVASCLSNSTSYASFPVANPTGIVTPNLGVNAMAVITVASTPNAAFVSEAQQDGLASYVLDSNPGDADFYGIASITSTPARVIATTVRGYMQKSDAGTRTAAVQLKSGATTVASPTLVLTTSGWQWTWRTDPVDPNTGVAWTPAAVNNAQIGPMTVA